MRNSILVNTWELDKYQMVLDAATGKKTDFTEEEKAKVLAIYTERAKITFGFDDEVLLKSVLSLDVPGANLLDKADADALDVLCELYKDWEQKPEKALAAKNVALSGDVSEALSLALVRAALDTLAGQTDIAPYREDIEALAEYLKQAGEDIFSDVSAFLVRVRERVR